MTFEIKHNDNVYSGFVIYSKENDLIIDLHENIMKKTFNKYEFLTLQKLMIYDFPFIPKIKNYFDIENDYYIIMEKINSSFVNIEVFYKVFDILKILHKYNIFHHDLHPHNILFSHDSFYLIDFGCATIDGLLNENNSAINDLNIEDCKFNKIYDISQLYCTFLTLCIKQDICKKKFKELDTFGLTIYDKLFYLFYVIEHLNLWENYNIYGLLDSYKYYDIILDYNKLKIYYFDSIELKKYYFKDYDYITKIIT